MNPIAVTFLSFFLLISSQATAFNITKLFSRHPEFSKFNDYLTQTNLASEINRHQTITVLAVEDSEMSALSGKTLDVVKKILSMHVILDYYDAQKLQDLTNKTALLTTMFQQTGTALNKQGFLNATELSTGEVVFGSAEKGAVLNAKLMKSVAAQPYNISVLQISKPVIAPGIDVIVVSSAPPPGASSPPPPPAPAPKSAKKVAKAPPPKSADAPAPDASAADAPAADAPAADAPAADAPASDAPAADAPASDAPAGSQPAPEPAADEASVPKGSSGTRVVFGYGFSVLMGSVMISLM